MKAIRTIGLLTVLSLFVSGCSVRYHTRPTYTFRHAVGVAVQDWDHTHHHPIHPIGVLLAPPDPYVRPVNVYPYIEAGTYY